MSTKPDDLDAVRTIAKTLTSFEPNEQERILRWVREKLGLSEQAGTVNKDKALLETEKDNKSEPIVDIKTFVTQKSPSTDKQLATTIAYYYALVAPVDQRKDSISAKDLRQSCRLVYGTSRLKNPAQTLVNAHNAGLLDKTGKHGFYKINTVGENLVALTLPSVAKGSRPMKKRAATRRKSKLHARKKKR